MVFGKPEPVDFTVHTSRLTEELQDQLWNWLAVVPRGAYEWGRESSDYDNYLLGIEWRSVLTLGKQRQVAQQTVRGQDNIHFNLGYKYTDYFRLGQTFSQVYFKINIFM
jgi:hypothetical protein